MSEPAGALARRPLIVKSPPLHEQVVASLRDMIVEGSLAPGERVPEQKLCLLFGISRTPLREALKVLAQEDFVRLEPNRGAIVTDLATDQVDAKFEVLAALESTAAAWAAARATDAELASLAAIHRRMLEEFARSDVPHYFRSNMEFHQAIVDACHNEVLRGMHGHLLMHLRRARYRNLSGLPNELRRTFTRDHGQIVAAMNARDPAGAAAAVESHNANVLRMLHGDLQAEGASPAP